MLEFFTSLLSPFLEALKINEEKSIRKSVIISKLKGAIRTTLKHIEETNPEKYTNDDFRFSDIESKELSRMWSEVAEAIRPFDARLAQTFEDKSDYWISPSGFIKDLNRKIRQPNFQMNIEEVRRIAAVLEYKWK